MEVCLSKLQVEGREQASPVEVSGMVAISFSVFLDELMVESNEPYVAKRQTIRRWNCQRQEWMKKNGIQVFWKQRYKGKKLFDAVLLRVICIRWVRHVYDGVETYALQVKLEGKEDWEYLYEPMLEDLARRDGFHSWNEMREWFVKKYGDGLLNGWYAVIRFNRTGV